MPYAYWLVAFGAALLLPAIGPAAEPMSPPKPKQTKTLFDRVQAVSFDSTQLKKDKTFVAVVPETWESRGDQNKKVLVVLHGRGRNERTLVDDKVIRDQLVESNLLVLLPDGDDGWYIDSPTQKAERYESYLEEVLQVASAYYRVPRGRQSWAIAGWSMGGYGAVRFAERHNEQFSSISSIIGLLDFPRKGLSDGQSYSVPTKRFGSDESKWRSLNPLQDAAKLRGMAVQILTANQAFDRTMNENFHDKLTALKIDHQWKVLRGGHKFDVVRKSIPIVLAHVKQNFERQNACEKNRPQSHEIEQSIDLE